MIDELLISRRTIYRARGWLALLAREEGRPKTSDIHAVLAEIDAAIAAAKAIEARSDKTGTGLAEGESAAPQGFAQTQSGAD